MTPGCRSIPAVIPISARVCCIPLPLIATHRAGSKPQRDLDRMWPLASPLKGRRVARKPPRQRRCACHDAAGFRPGGTVGGATAPPAPAACRITRRAADAEDRKDDRELQDEGTRRVSRHAVLLLPRRLGNGADRHLDDGTSPRVLGMGDGKRPTGLPPTLSRGWCALPGDI